MVRCTPIARAVSECDLYLLLIRPECAHCEEYGFECTYMEAAKRRGPPKGYVETLEQRCGRLEKALHEVRSLLRPVSDPRSNVPKSPSTTMSGLPWTGLNSTTQLIKRR